jgi:tRNA (guanine-N7-)-methyltransferase
LTLGDLAAALAERESWQLEIGFGKGRHLLRSAVAHPETGFVGIEVAAEYFRLVASRATRQALDNVVLIRGDALQLLSVYLPARFADAVHVYFPDPWPKSRHHKRRLFDPETVDLVVGALRPGGRLFVATDHVEYGEAICAALESHANLRVERLATPWPDGARTNYESKYLEEGRPILRLIGERAPSNSAHDRLHPAGERGIVEAWPRQADPATVVGHVLPGAADPVGRSRAAAERAQHRESSTTGS